VKYENFRSVTLPNKDASDIPGSTACPLPSRPRRAAVDHDLSAAIERRDDLTPKEQAGRLGADRALADVDLVLGPFRMDRALGR